jgi:cysteine-rich repeat protein
MARMNRIGPSWMTLAAATAAATLWACGGTAPSTCGNGRLEKGESCDDGNVSNDDACSNTCQPGVQPGTDAGSPDGGTFTEGPDAGTPDAGAQDAGQWDAGEPDAGTRDGGEPDAGELDAGAQDAGEPDAGELDGGTPDAGSTVTPNPYPHPGHVVISELQTTGPTGDAADEFVEFYNPTDAEVDLSGHTVRFVNSATSITRTLCTFPGSSGCACTGFNGRLPPHGYLLLGTDVFAAQPGRPAPDCTWNTNAQTGTLGQYGGHLRLAAPDGGMVDVLGWWDGAFSSSKPVAPEGTPATGLTGDGASVERKPLSSATAADMAPGGPYLLSGNSCDTDDNGADFVLRAVAEPQNLSSPPEP